MIKGENTTGEMRADTPDFQSKYRRGNWHQVGLQWCGNVRFCSDHMEFCQSPTKIGVVEHFFIENNPVWALKRGGEFVNKETVAQTTKGTENPTNW